MTTQFQLTMQSGPTPGKVFPLEGDMITIGREADNGVVIPDPEISRKHTKLVLQNGQYSVSDMGSTNGTFVNGQRVATDHVLVSGEVISLSEQINLLFEAIAPAAPAFQGDPNATILSPGRAMAATPPPMPAPTPEPEPVIASTPAPTPAPTPKPVDSPLPSTPAPVKTGGNSRTAIIIAVVVVLCLLCCCLIGAGYYVRSAHMFGF